MMDDADELKEYRRQIALIDQQLADARCGDGEHRDSLRHTRDELVELVTLLSSNEDGDDTGTVKGASSREQVRDQPRAVNGGDTDDDDEEDDEEDDADEGWPSAGARCRAPFNVAGDGPDRLVSHHNAVVLEVANGDEVSAHIRKYIDPLRCRPRCSSSTRWWMPCDPAASFSRSDARSLRDAASRMAIRLQCAC